jgi:hypothetical protein
MTSKDNGQDEELLARYRRASDTDAAAPSESVRNAILAESRRVAEQRAKKQHPFDVSRPAANDARWKITAFGTAGAALLAALLIAPRFWESQRPTQVASVTAAAPAAKSASSKTAPVPERASSDAAEPAPAAAPTPKLEEAKPYAALSNAAPTRQSNSESLQEIVVTQAERKASKPSADALQRYAASTPPAAPSAYTGGAAQGGALSMSAARAGIVPTPASLQAAAGLGDVRQAASLLDQGVAVDARDADGRTPLMLAVAQGRLEVVRLLLARGADPNAADNSGRSPLQQARAGNLRDVAALLERAGAH